MLKSLIGYLVLFSMFASSHAEQATRIMMEKYQPPILGKDSTYTVEKFDTTTIWIGKDRALWNQTHSDFRSITYNDSSKVLLLRPKFEIFQVLDRPGAAGRDSAVTLEDDLAIGLGQLKQVEVWSITPTGDTSTVRNVKCHRFEFVMKNDYGEQLDDVWISDDRDEQIPAFHLAYHGFSFYLVYRRADSLHIRPGAWFTLCCVVSYCLFKARASASFEKA